MTGPGALSHSEISDTVYGAGRQSVESGEALPGIVLVPGMDGTGRLFYRQEPLLARNFRVATFPLPDDVSRMESLVDHLSSFVAATFAPSTPVVLCGESFGGTLSLSFALRHPARVRGLVIINSFPFFRPQYRLHAALTALQVMPWGTMALVRRLTAFRMHSRYTHRAELERFLVETRATTKRGYLNRLRILTDYSVLADLHRIAAPTLFLAADRDHLVPAVDQARLMAARVPNATLRILEGHGHICLIAPNLDLSALIAEWGALGSGTPHRSQREQPAGG